MPPAISGVDVVIVRETDQPSDNRQHTALVVVRTTDGTVGIGEGNAHPAALKAFIEQNCGCGGWDRDLRDLLLGEDPSDPRRLWDLMVRSTPWSYRSGVGHVARAAIDMALWDLAGRLAGVPAWRLLGDAVNPAPRPYVTMWHGDVSFEDTMRTTLEALDAARAQGFTAAKLEAMPGNAESADEIVAMVTRAREHVGDDFTLMLDVGYRFRDADEAIHVLGTLDEAGLAFVEAPFPPECLECYARLGASIATPIATGDLLTAAVDYLGLLGLPSVAILQGGACRTGMSDMLWLADETAARGRQFLSWGWVATALTTQANLAVSIVRGNIPFVEYAPPSLYPDSPLRNTLFGPEPELVDGAFALPDAPGLGVTLDPDALRRFGVGVDC
jgi:L-alanine-DL-glutamate epimerase-like enolase superfamily enzyme